MAALVLLAGVSLAEAAAPRAIWIWEDAALRLLDSPHLRRQTVAFLRDRKIGMLYLYADAFKDRDPVEKEPARLAAAIAEFHRHGFLVYALLGSAFLGTERYILPEKRDVAARMLGRILDFNARAAAGGRFDGVNLDIEPYILEGWKTQRAELACRYLDLCETFVRMRNASEPGLILGPAIPFWFDEIPVSWRGREALLSEHVQRLFEYVAIMDYRDTATGPDGIIDHAEAEIAFADGIGSKVVIGVETLETKPEKLTFHEEGTRAMERELRLVEEAFRSRPSFAGFAVHHLDSYRSLPTRR